MAEPRLSVVPKSTVEVLPPVSKQPSPVALRKSLRSAVEDVFWELGGTEGMIKWAGESTANKRIFYKDILTKVIPREIQGQLTGGDGGPVRIQVEWLSPTGEGHAAVDNGQSLAAVGPVVNDVVVNALGHALEDEG